MVDSSLVWLRDVRYCGREGRRMMQGDRAARASAADRGCATHKLDGDLMSALLRPGLEALIACPYNAREIEDVVWSRLALALEHPRSVYRVIDRGHIYAYPRAGPPQQYIAWQQGQWMWQDLPDGALRRLRITIELS